MSTKKKTTTTAAFDPSGTAAYNSLQPAVFNGLNQDTNNPWTAIGGNAQLAQGNNQIFGSTQQANQGLLQSFSERGIADSSPLVAQQLAQTAGAGRQQQAGVYNNLLLTAGNVATQGAGAASQYQPLQTGNTSTSSQSGLGTWLPQILAAAGKAASVAAS